MSYEVFDGKKSIMIMRNQDDLNTFHSIKDKLGLKKDIDVVALCASVALCKHQKSLQNLDEMPSKEKIANISSFTDRYLFDSIIKVYLEKEDEIRETFESYFYTGLNILGEWLNQRGVDIKYELEAFSDILDYIGVIESI